MPETFADSFSTSLTSAIPDATRPVTFTVAAMSAQLQGGSFSVLVYDPALGPTGPGSERLYVTSTNGTTWTADTESSDIPKAHALGSSVAQVLTARSVTQPVRDHTDTGQTPDPHPNLIRKAAFLAPGDLLAGTGPGAFTRVPSGPDGSSPIADSSQPSGWRMGLLSAISTVLSAVGDLLFQGAAGAQRLPIGTLGQRLTVVNNPPAITNPGVAPTLANTTSANPPAVTWAPNTGYVVGYAYQNAQGQTLLGPLAAYAAPAVPVAQDVTTPAAPAGCALLVYVGADAATMHLVATLANPNTAAQNIVTIGGPNPAGGAPANANTTGGLGPGWQAGASMTFGAPGASRPGDAITTGTATDAAHADHLHGREAFAANSTSVAFGGNTLAGVAQTVAHGDHSHGLPPLPAVLFWQSGLALALATGDTITVTGEYTMVVLAPTADVTGIVLAPGGFSGLGWAMYLWLVNDSAFHITFATNASNVADADQSPIPPYTARLFLWVPTTSLWWRAA